MKYFCDVLWYAARLMYLVTFIVRNELTGLEIKKKATEKSDALLVNFLNEWFFALLSLLTSTAAGFLSADSSLPVYIWGYCMGKRPPTNAQMRNNMSKRRRQKAGTFGQTRFVRRCHRAPAFIGCDNGFFSVSANIAKGSQVAKKKRDKHRQKAGSLGATIYVCHRRTLLTSPPCIYEPYRAADWP